MDHFVTVVLPAFAILAVIAGVVTASRRGKTLPGAGGRKDRRPTSHDSWWAGGGTGVGTSCGGGSSCGGGGCGGD
ncbi:hypothetical protein [Streptomyces sp. NPDC050504]|uniref:hypothetical protein n=1 Tax=Streptomyces sp. NPDC050504 TaxID=3365618 RepID=UPI0037A372D8